MHITFPKALKNNLEKNYEIQVDENKKEPGGEIFRSQYSGVSIVPPTTAVLIRATSEEKQEEEHYRG